MCLEDFNGLPGLMRVNLYFQIDSFDGWEHRGGMSIVDKALDAI